MTQFIQVTFALRKLTFYEILADLDHNLRSGLRPDVLVRKGWQDMTVTIEQIDPANLIVRCVQPPNPPFKSTMISESISEATETAASMLRFPDHQKTRKFGLDPVLQSSIDQNQRS